MINKASKVFIPDADYGLSRINKVAAIEAFIGGVMLIWFIVLCIVHSKNWFVQLSVAMQIIVVILVGIAAILLLLVIPVVAGFLAKYKHGSFSNVAGGTKLAIIDDKVYEFNIERVAGDRREALDVGKIKEIIDKAGNKQTAKDWIIENILKAIGREKQINLADVSIPLPGETEVSKDTNKEHLELAVNKCEILEIKQSEQEDSIEVTYRYDFGNGDGIGDNDIIKYKPKNFVRFADDSLSGYKELVDSLEKIARKQ